MNRGHHDFQVPYSNFDGFFISGLKVVNFWGLFLGGQTSPQKTSRMERGVITAGGKGQRIQSVILSAIFFDANCTCSVIFCGHQRFSCPFFSLFFSPVLL